MTTADHLRDLYHQLDGQDIPGGCDHCDAFQKMRPVPGSEGMVWRLTTFHDDDCSQWLEMQTA